jgi:hypothetical protein
MSSSFAPGFIFEQESINSHSDRASRTPLGAALTLHDLTPKLIALAGLALFGCALVVAFRVVALDAARQLQEPGVDIAICGAVALLGLAISWIHLGDSAKQTAQAAAKEAEAVGSALIASTVPPAPTLARVAASTNKPRSTRLGHFCPFCGQKMIALGSARSGRICPACRHLEDHRRDSFLDGAQACECRHCRQIARTV